MMHPQWIQRVDLESKHHPTPGTWDLYGMPHLNPVSSTFSKNPRQALFKFKLFQSTPEWWANPFLNRISAFT
jgi:hypothetical protein